jgi:preprotein translocase subunit SecE
MDEIKEKAKIIIQKVTQFLKEAKTELKKVTWPTPKQTMASTAVVIILVFIVSLILGVIDFGLAKLVKLILG